RKLKALSCPNVPSAGAMVARVGVLAPRASSGGKLRPMSGDAALWLMIAGIHLLALGCVVVLMIPALRGGPEWPPASSDSGSDDGWGNEPRRPPSPQDVPGGGLP